MEKTDYVLSKDHLRLIEDLNFIANIPKRCKVNMTDKTIVSDTSLYGSVKRKWLDEDRKKTVQEIKNLVSSVLKILPDVQIQWKKELFIESLWKAKTGLNNLKNTYNDDISISAMYEVIIKMIDNAIDDVSSKDETMNEYIISLK